MRMASSFINWVSSEYLYFFPTATLNIVESSKNLISSLFQLRTSIITFVEKEERAPKRARTDASIL